MSDPSSLSIPCFPRSVQLTEADWSSIVSLLWSMPTALVLTETVSGRIVAVNEAFERVVGYGSVRLVGRTTVELGFHHSQDARANLIDPVLRGGRFHRSETQLRTAAGELRSVVLSCRRLRHDHADRLLTLLDDVTPQRQMEQSLRDSEERYRRIFSESIDPIAILEWDQTTGIGRAIEVNDRMVDLLGYNRRELLSMPIAQWESPSNRQPRSEVETLLRTGQAITIERVCKRADGHFCTVEMRAGLMQWQGQSYVMAHLRDITARLRMEETLRLNEASLRLALTATNVTLFRTDRHLRVNWAFNPARGYSANVARPGHSETAANLPKRSRIARLLEQVMRSGTGARGEINILRNGEVRAHEMVVEPIRDDDGAPAGVTAAVVDVSARKAAENEVRKAMQRFELLTEASPVGIFRADATGLVTHANSAAQLITGRSLAEIRQMHVTAFVPDEDRSVATEAWVKLVQGESEYGCEYRIVRPSGDVRWVFAQVRPIFAQGRFEQAIGTITDITEHRSVHEILRGLVHAGTLPGATLTNGLARIAQDLQAEFGCIVTSAAEPNRCTLRALWRDHAIAENLNESLGTCPCRELLSDDLRVVVSGLAQYTPDTVRRWAPDCEAAIVAPLLGPQQRPLGHLCLIWRAPILNEAAVRRLVELVLLPFGAELAREREATERRHIEDQLLQSQKFEALGALASGIAHDFNNVLTAILNNATLAQATNQTTAEQRETCLTEIIHACSRASELVRQILSFSRRQRSDTPEERVPVNLRTVITDALRFLRPSTLPSITLESTCDPATPLVRGQVSQMHQAVMNLCVNATQAVGDKVGSILLQLEPYVLDEIAAAALPPLALGRYAKLTITDTGCGIAPEYLPRVFEPFYTTKANHGGTGLGLALVHKIVADHGGAITVESSPGQGARFTLYLPAETGVVANDDPELSVEIPRGSGEHLLLVDDEPQVADSFRALLDGLGYRVSAFTHPAKALAVYWAAPLQFDAAILDYRMPGMMGDALAQQLSHIRPELPVALLSGYPGELGPELVQQCGGAELLSKPLSFSELAFAVHRILQKGKTHSVYA